ncbi:hypothetical protein BDW71DRAFT_190745 [Aspergillus fruticulosus]
MPRRTNTHAAGRLRFAESRRTSKKSRLFAADMSMSCHILHLDAQRCFRISHKVDAYSLSWEYFIFLSAKHGICSGTHRG